MQVPMQGTGAEELVVVMTTLKGVRAKGFRYPAADAGQPVQGGACEGSKVVQYSKETGVAGISQRKI